MHRSSRKVWNPSTHQLRGIVHLCAWCSCQWDLPDVACSHTSGTMQTTACILNRSQCSACSAVQCTATIIERMVRGPCWGPCRYQPVYKVEPLCTPAFPVAPGAVSTSFLCVARWLSLKISTSLRSEACAAAVNSQQNGSESPVHTTL